MASNASRGAAAKLRSKKWLINRGYVVCDAEILRTIFLPGGRKVYSKRDQWGADIFAMNAEVNVHVQVKSGACAAGGTFPEARREFAKYPHPAGTRKIILAWGLKARHPRLVEVFADGTYREVMTEGAVVQRSARRLVTPKVAGSSPASPASLELPLG